MTDATEDLRAAGLRVTAPRRSVLEWLTGHPHATADQVGAGVRATYGSISHQTVYDVLGAGVRVGLVRRIELAGHPARYERRADDHHHLACRRCGRVADVEGVAGPAPCPQTGGTGAGFAVEDVEVTFWGVCPDCAPRQGTRD